MLKSYITGALMLGLLFVPGLPARDAAAQSVVSSGQSFIQARMMPGLKDEGGARVIGIRLSMAPGWKTYWRSPGEAGIPPSFDWSASRNLASAQVFWPRPQVFQSFGMQTIGYADQVVLPIRVTPQDPSAPIEMAGDLQLGVCKDICVLEQVSLAQTIAPDTPEIGRGQIRRALRLVPPAGADIGLTRAECRILGTGRDRTLEVALSFEQDVVKPLVLFEGHEGYWVSGAQTHVADGAVRATATLNMARGVAWVDRSTLRMTVLAQDFAADIQGCTSPAG